ncbi:MAG: RHS repeat-associated core domain-containing protein, partial [Hominilimicola sp.]
YDSAGRVIKITSGGAYINYSYGLNDVTMTDGEGNTTRKVYDIAGNVVYSVGADNTVSYAQYNDAMFTEGLSVGLTTKATYEYDENNRPVKITMPDGTDTAYSYSSGAISSITAPGGARTAYNRNDKGELTNIVYNDGVDEEYSYNSMGYVEAFTQRDGQKVIFEYDSKGNVTKETYSGGRTRSFTYDKYGNVLTINENGSVTTMTYNDKGDITSVQYPNGRSVFYGYDAAGRRTSFTDNEGNITSYGYDDSGNLSTVSNSDGILVQYEYNTDGTRRKQTNANGTYTVYSYSGGKVIKIVNYSSDNSVISSYEYAYNSEGYISSVTSENTVESYTYDEIGQLTEVTSSNGAVTQYEYDEAGNRVSVKVNGEVTNYTADNMNRYTKVGDAVRSYDKNGHLISEKTADGTASYEWDYLGRMSKMTTADGKVYEYEYDAFGNRSAVTVDGDRTEYLNDPTGYGFAAAQYHNGEVTRYVLADGIVAQEKNDKDYFYNYNHLGSTTEITDSNGAVVNRYKYSHTGEVRSRYESIANPFTYVGMGGIMEDGNGLWYDRARYVSIDSGSFISPDPTGQQYDLNLYRYANNNSVNYFDLSGEVGESAIIKPVIKILKGFGSALLKQGTKQSTKQGGKAVVKQTEKNIFESTAKNNVSNYTPDDVLSGKVQKEIDSITKDYNNTKAAMNGTAIGAAESVSGGLSAMAEEQTVIEGCVTEDLIGVGAIIGGIAGAATRSPLGVIAGVIIGSILDSASQASNDKHGVVEAQLKPVTPKADPSGYVYAGVTSNVIEGVEAVIYYEGYPLDEFGEPDYDAGLQTLVWAEAADYNEENPQLTDAFGRYGWDTPEGKWRVEYKKDGYETAWSDWMGVPPEYTDVNINLMTTEAPKIENINVYTDGIEIRFNQYMDISSVNETAITVSAGGQTVSGTVKPSNAEYNYEQTAQYASVFEFETAATLSGDVTVNVSGAKNYAGIAMNKDESVTGEALIRPTGIEMETSYNVDNGSEQTIRAQILPKEAGAGKKLIVTSYSPSIASVTDTEVTADENGIAEFTVNGLLPGSAVMSVKIDGSDISQEFSVLVKSAEKNKTMSIAVDGRYNTENTLIVAVYRADNTLISAKCKKPDGSGKDVFEFENDIEAAYVKIMEWNSLEGMQPEGVCETRYLE